jgi:hypothetical protein
LQRLRRRALADGRIADGDLDLLTLSDDAEVVVATVLAGRGRQLHDQ